jgi:hypothetical protein
MQIHRSWIAVSIAAIVVGAAAPALAQAPAKPLQVQETNMEGITAELTGVTQSDGVLTVRLRFRNTGDKTRRVQIVTHPNDIDKYYVVAGTTKLLPLRDSDKVPLMSALNSGGNIEPELKPGTSYLFWAKFPAPAAGTKKIAIYTVPAPPFEDVQVPQ